MTIEEIVRPEGRVEISLHLTEECIMPNPIPPERRAEWTALLAELWAACEAAGVDCPTIGAGDDTPGSQPGAPRRYVCGARLPDGRELGFEGPEPFWPVQACTRALRAEVLA